MPHHELTRSDIRGRLLALSRTKALGARVSHTDLDAPRDVRQDAPRPPSRREQDQGGNR
ncbi:MAG: hypothetical protein PW843_02175 [Azospirillaceae bacterium]|nr:hypothetical protein [Azospirillaceae bacterium]